MLDRLVRVLLLATVAVVACHELYFADDDLRDPTTMAKAGDTCVRDDDCVVMPALLTCCGECEPIAPYEAVPRAVLAERRRALEASCAPRTQPCDPPACTAPPAGCVVRAVCDQGQCRAVTNARCSSP